MSSVLVVGNFHFRNRTSFLVPKFEVESCLLFSS